MKKIILITAIFVLAFSLTACNLNIDASGSNGSRTGSRIERKDGKSPDVMENVEFRKLDSSYSIDNWYADVYGEFSEGQISEIEEKISKKEYSVISDPENLRAIAICDLDSDGTAEALVISLCYPETYGSMLDYYSVSGGKMKKKLYLQNGGFDEDGYEVQGYYSFIDFDGLEISGDGHTITACETLGDDIKRQSCKIENGKFVFTDLPAEEYEHNMKDLFAVFGIAKKQLSPHAYSEIKKPVESRNYVIFECNEAVFPTKNVVVCDIDNDGEFEAVVTGTIGSGMINETFDVFGIKDGKLLPDEIGFDNSDNSENIPYEIGMSNQLEENINISKDGTEILYIDNSRTLGVYVEKGKYIFTKYEVAE